MTDTFLWLIVALASYLTFALVFVADKIILTKSTISRPVQYTFYSGILGLGLIVLFPLAPELPSFDVLWRSTLVGITQLGALYLFFTSMKYGEASRVVPIAGGSVPFFTFLLAFVFLGEHLPLSAILAFILLVGGGLLLSIRLKEAAALSPVAWSTAIGAGLLFAAFFVLSKSIYDVFTFIPALVTMRTVTGILALILLGPFMLKIYGGIRKKRSVPKSGQFGRKTTAAVFFGSKALGAVAGFLQQYAVSLGPVTIINALQGTQYAFLLIVAAIFTRRFPHILKEEFSRLTLIQKIAGILLVTAGVGVLIWALGGDALEG